MVILNFLRLDPVVGDVSANESDVNNLKLVLDSHDQPVAIAFDIEHQPPGCCEVCWLCGTQL
jgi:hypothetical protein